MTEELKPCPAITSHPDVMSGQHVLAGTRIPFRAIIAFFQGGCSYHDIVREYPDLAPEKIFWALEFALDAITRPQDAEVERLRADLLDCATMIRRMQRVIRKCNKDDKLVAIASEFLRRKRLAGSPLRETDLAQLPEES